MKLNIAQCRSTKKSAALRGLRRVTRNSSSCSLSPQQQKLAGSRKHSSTTVPNFLSFLPVSTLPPPSREVKQKKARQIKRKETGKPSPSRLEALEPYIKRSLKLNVLHENQPCIQKSYDAIEFSALEKERSSKLENTLLSKQRSFKSEVSFDTCISRQTSFRLEALIEPRVLSRTSSCTTIGRKRVVGVDDLSQELDFHDCSSPLSPSSSVSDPEFSPRKRFASPRTPSSCLDRSPWASLTLAELQCPFPWSCLAPSSPSTLTGFTPDRADGEDSLLEELPFDLLVSIAQHYHFCFTTPHREKKGKTVQLFQRDGEQSTFQGGLAERFIRPPTPNAPKHLPRPAELRFSHIETCPIAPLLFEQESLVACSRKSMRMTGMVSHRVLFDEDELCHAVAQNTL